MKKLADVSVKIEADLKEQMDALAAEQDMSISEIVRFAFRIYIFISKTRKVLIVSDWMAQSALKAA